jgi:hypothetical protein
LVTALPVAVNGPETVSFAAGGMTLKVVASLRTSGAAMTWLPEATLTAAAPPLPEAASSVRALVPARV